jgi:SAM-dependent methyltransferase
MATDTTTEPREQPRILQSGQPAGVPPLELTGERTLPDVPEENYWFRRHLVVYEWIAQRVGGQRVVDMACGEGYGTAVLARGAAHVTGVDANPEAHEHAKAKYEGERVSIVRDLIETYREPADAVVFLQTIEHLHDASAALRHFGSMLEPGGAVYVSTPNVLTLAPEGADRSDNPFHIHEYRAEEFRQLCAGVFGEVELHGLYHARKLRVHEVAIRYGWDAVHKKLGFTKLFYDRFTPAISERDFRLRKSERPADLDGALDFLAVCRRPR